MITKSLWLPFLAAALHAQVQPVSYANAIIPQIPAGCGWMATILMVNLTNHAVGFTVNFWPQAGLAGPNATPVPRLIPIIGLGTVSSIADTIPPGGSYTIKSDEAARDSTDSCNGWAEVDSDEVIGGYVLLNQQIMVQTQESLGGIQVQQTTEFQFETTVPFASRFAPHFIVPFDATSFTSAVAIVNPSFQVGADVNVSYRDGSGQPICSETRSLKPGEQQAFTLAPPVPPAQDVVPPVCGSPSYTALQGKSGVVEVVTSNLEFSGLALRFGPFGFVSYPAQVPIGQ